MTYKLCAGWRLDMCNLRKDFSKFVLMTVRFKITEHQETSSLYTTIQIVYTFMAYEIISAGIIDLVTWFQLSRNSNEVDLFNCII